MALDTCQHMEIHQYMQTWKVTIIMRWALDHRLVHIVASRVADVQVIRGTHVRSDPLSVDES